jgi:REP element-mobilizing transposase RayT
VPRRPRLIEPGGIYHVTSHGVDTIRIFRGDSDRVTFLNLLAPATRRFGWDVFMVCLMDTHIHVLLQVREPTLSVGMERIKGDYARAYNRAYGRRGHLFEGRFGSRQIATDGHLLNTIRYIAMNPVEARMCRDPEEYAWCSYGATVGVGRRWPWISDEPMLAQFGPTRSRAVEVLRDFVGERRLLDPAA